MSGPEGHIHLHQIVNIFKKKGAFNGGNGACFRFWSRCDCDCDAVISRKYNDLCFTARNEKHKQTGGGQSLEKLEREEAEK